MSLFTLYTYHKIDEPRQIQKIHEVHPFFFDETQELLRRKPAVVIDISAVVYLMQTNKGNQYSANFNLREMTIETRVIVKRDIADDAISFFPHLFVND